MESVDYRVVPSRLVLMAQYVVTVTAIQMTLLLRGVTHFLHYSSVPLLHYRGQSL